MSSTETTAAPFRVDATWSNPAAAAQVGDVDAYVVLDASGAVVYFDGWEVAAKDKAAELNKASL